MKPKSNFATLLENSVWCMGSMPTDSFPGKSALYTGATPRTHGIWYDAAYHRTYYPYTAKPGFTLVGDETLDVNNTILTGGGAFDNTNLPYEKTP
jgi:hypothetical protein